MRGTKNKGKRVGQRSLYTYIYVRYKERKTFKKVTFNLQNRESKERKEVGVYTRLPTYSMSLVVFRKTERRRGRGRHIEYSC